jgi:hypothetical protein
VEGRQLEERDGIALDLVGVLGLSAFFLGLTWLRTSENLGFDVGKAIDGILGQLPVTLPAALLILGATALELAAGLVLARAARNRPFDSIAEALIASMVVAVLKDTLLLGVLGGFGLFLAPALIAIDVAIVALAWLPAIALRLRPLTAFVGWPDHAAAFGSWTIAVLVAVVWLGPVLLQLASPVVPFIDVLPNYVGPVEHLRTFGWFSPLTATQSPIIGPSRTVLGYDALLGSLATMTGLPGGLAIAGFILPQAVLVAAGAYRLAGAIRGTDPHPGLWALLAFALTQPFGRLADARGTVVVVPLVCLGVALAGELLTRPKDADAADEAAGDGAADANHDPWRIGRGAVMGLAFGAATMVHPVIGFFAVVTVGIAALVRPAVLAPAAFVAAVTAGLIALPQLATMVGLVLPTISLAAGLAVAIGIGIAVGRAVATNQRLSAGLVRLAGIARIAAVVVAIGGIAVAFATSRLILEDLPAAVGTTANLALESSGILLLALVTGGLVGSRGARSTLVLAGLGVGVGAVLLTQVLPGDLGFLGRALRFEVPKTVHYWVSGVAAAGAACALAFVWSSGRPALPWLARVGLLIAFVVGAALPIRPKPIDAAHLGEHRWSETFAIDLHYAGSGYWLGFPDSRTIVDPRRQAIVGAIRAEIEAGRLRHDTPVLHVASSFQQWDSTPLGVFDGVTETSVSEKPEVSHQTVGGRLFGYDQLPGFLSGRAYPYVVLEPDGVPPGFRDEIVAAGYRSIFRNDQGEVFTLGG